MRKTLSSIIVSILLTFSGNPFFDSVFANEISGKTNPSNSSNVDTNTKYNLENIVINKDSLFNTEETKGLDQSLVKEAQKRFKNFKNPFIAKIFITGSKEDLDKIKSVEYDFNKILPTNPEISSNNSITEINRDKTRKFVYILGLYGYFNYTINIKLNDDKTQTIKGTISNKINKIEDFLPNPQNPILKIFESKDKVKNNISTSDKDYKNIRKFSSEISNSFRLNVLDFLGNERDIDSYDSKKIPLEEKANIVEKIKYYRKKNFDNLKDFTKEKIQNSLDSLNLNYSDVSLIKFIKDSKQKDSKQIESLSTISKINTPTSDNNRIPPSSSKNQNIPSSYLNSKLDTLANGVSAFLIERAKLELIITFMQEFKQKFIKDNNLKNFFPKTIMLLETQNKITNSELFFNSLKTSFYDDLKALPLSLKLNLNDQNNFGELVSLVLNNLDKQQSSFLNFIMDISTMIKFDNEKDQNTLIAIREILTNLNEEPNINFSFPDYLGKLLEDDYLLDNYINLIKVVVDKKFAQNDFSDIKIKINKILDSKTAFKRLILRGVELSKIYQQIIDKNNKIKISINTYSEEKNNLIKELTGLYKSYSNNAIKLIQEMNDLINPEENDKSQLSEIFKAIENTSDFYFNLLLEDYESSMINLVSILDNTSIFSNQDMEKNKEFFKYVSFVSDIVKSEKQEDVQKALEKVALPVGSSALRKSNSFSADLGAYVGTKINSKKYPDKSLSEISPIDISAPIGLNLSWGFNQYGSVTGFISMFDVGSVVEYQINNNNQPQTNINFKNLVNPGLTLLYGFGGNIPLSFGAGVRWAPYQSQSINTDNNTTINKIDISNFNYNLFLGVDIPIISLGLK